MNQEMMLAVQQAAQLAAVDVIKAQIVKGAKKQGIDKKRHVAVVADVVNEMVESYPVPDGQDASEWLRRLMRAALSGSLLNASQLRQQMEKAGVLDKEMSVDDEYGV